MLTATQPIDSNSRPLGGALLLPVKDTATTLNISIRTVWRLIDAKHLEAVRIGGRTLVTAASVRRVAEQGAA